MYQTILVPVDGSAPSQAGLAEAIRLAGAMRARLVLLHVIETAAAITTPEAAAPASLFEALREGGAEILARARTEAETAGLVVETVLLDNIAGRVSDLIVDEAARHRADVIVMGTHGHHGIQRMLLGSDAEQVLRAATVPVLMVRAPRSNSAPASSDPDAATPKKR